MSFSLKQLYSDNGRYIVSHSNGALKVIDIEVRPIKQVLTVLDRKFKPLCEQSLKIGSLTIESMISKNVDALGEKRECFGRVIEVVIGEYLIISGLTIVVVDDEYKSNNENQFVECIMDKHWLSIKFDIKINGLPASIGFEKETNGYLYCRGINFKEENEQGIKDCFQSLVIYKAWDPNCGFNSCRLIKDVAFTMQSSNWTSRDQKEQIPEFIYIPVLLEHSSLYEHFTISRAKRRYLAISSHFMFCVKPYLSFLLTMYEELIDRRNYDWFDIGVNFIRFKGFNFMIFHANNSLNLDTLPVINYFQTFRSQFGVGTIHTTPERIILLIKVNTDKAQRARYQYIMRNFQFCGKDIAKYISEFVVLKFYTG